MPTFNFPFNQISEKQKKFLQYLCHSNSPSKILEIGSWVGESTSVFAEYAKEYNSTLYCVDWFKGNPGTEIGETAKSADIFGIFRNNLSELGLMDYVHPLVMTSKEAAAIVADETFDLIFIDADHTYKNIRNDIDLWFSKVRKDGIFCGHDCEAKEYDERFIDVDFAGNKHHGVIKAVFETFPEANITENIWWIKK